MYRHLIFLMWVGLVQSVEDPTRKKGLILPWLRDLLMHVCLSLNQDFVLFCFVFLFFFPCFQTLFEMSFSLDFKPASLWA